MAELVAWFHKHPNVRVSFRQQFDSQYFMIEMDNMYVHYVNNGCDTRYITSRQIDMDTLLRPDKLIDILNKMYNCTLQATYDD